MANISKDAKIVLETFYKSFKKLRQSAKEVKSLIEQDAEEYAKLNRLSFGQALERIIMERGFVWGERAKTLVQQYNSFLSRLSHLLPELTPRLGSKVYLAIPSQLSLQECFNENFYNLMSMVIEGCTQALAFIGSLLKPELSHIERSHTGRRKLEDLRREVERLEDPNVRYHLLQAIREYESEHHLAATLIAGKVAVYAIEQLKSLFGVKSDEEAAEKLAAALGVKDIERRMLILKACKLARNYFTHNLNAVPTASDALSFVADAVKLAKWLSLVKARGKSAHQLTEVSAAIMPERGAEGMRESSPR